MPALSRTPGCHRDPPERHRPGDEVLLTVRRALLEQRGQRARAGGGAGPRARPSTCVALIRVSRTQEHWLTLSADHSGVNLACQDGLTYGAPSGPPPRG